MPLFLFVGGCLLAISSLATELQNWPLISADELAERLDSTRPPLILDIRGREKYLEGAIPGALDAGTEPAGFLPDNSGDLLVLIVTDSSAIYYIAPWVERLQKAGHPVAVLDGGFISWQNSGRPIEQPEVSFTRPGTVPFLIPRGLCEGGEPAQVFE